MNRSNWIEVDRQGLAKLLGRRSRGYLVLELVQNALDTKAGKVEVTLAPVKGKPWCQVTVVDDDPDGFSDLSHSYRLFAESEKKADPNKRGRFNAGEKLVLAIAREAKIASTTGTIVFDAQGRHDYPRRKTAAGSIFEATLELTRDEQAHAETVLKQVLVDAGVHLTVNGQQVPSRKPDTTFEAQLDTEVADDDGVLRRRRRKAQVDLYRVDEPRPARLYELGLPVTHIDGVFDVDVRQKVPLSMERDTVPARWLSKLYAHVLNNTAEQLSAKDAAAEWISAAIARPEIAPEAVTAVVRGRYGDKAAVYDPSDLEANQTLVSRGYTVVPGGAFSKEAWANIKQAEALVPAGRIRPTPNPSFSINGKDCRLGEETWMEPFRSRVLAIAEPLLDGLDLSVEFVDATGTTNRRYRAWYGQQTLTYNVGALGRGWFKRWSEEHVSLLVHELGHQWASSHLDSEYHDALCRLSGKLARLIADNPRLMSSAL